MTLLASTLILLPLATVGLTGPEALNDTMATIEQLTKQKKAPVVVLDLDSTLFNNGPRTRQILLEVAATDPTLRQYYDEIERLPTDLPYLVTDVLAKAGIRSRPVVAKFEQGWKERFFTDEYVVHDTAINGAVHYVYGAAQRGATIVYLTGRNAPGMGAGTVQSLKRSGFPVLLPNAVLMMKPNKEMPDETFKRAALEQVSNMGYVVATFENEPANANLFASRWPDAKHFLLLTNSDPKKKTTLSRSVFQIKDFTLSNKLKASTPSTGMKLKVLK